MTYSTSDEEKHGAQSTDAMELENKEDPESEISNLPTPPDGGWGWVVVFGSFMIHVIADGIAYSFGIFLVSFLDYFETAGRGELGWIGSLMVGVTLSVGPIASVLTNKYGCRVVTITGAVIASCGFILSIFAPNIIYLYFSYGILTGLGLGLIYLPAIVSVTYYFEKKRAFATGLAVCGSGLGTFSIASLTKLLLDTYGWKGATLIEGGILLNCVVCGALFRPLIAPKKERVDSNDAKPSDVEANGVPPSIGRKSGGEPIDIVHNSDKVMLSSSASLPNDMIRMYNPQPRINDIKDEHLAVKLHLSEHCLSQSHHRKSPEKSEVRTTTHRKDAFYNASLQNIPLYRSNRSLYTQSMTSLHRDVAHVESEASSCVPACCQISTDTKQSFKEMMDLSLLSDPLFVMFAISNFLTSIGFNTPFIYLPDRARVAGIDADKAAFLISVVGITNTIGRVVFGWLADKPFVNRLMLYSTALTLCGIFTALSSFCNSYPLMVAYAAIFGVLIGVYVSLTSVVLVDLLGLEKLTNAFGLLLLFQGIATIIGPPIAGWMFDATESYNISFWIVGTMIGLSGFMLYFIPCVRRAYEKKEGVNEQDINLGKKVDNPDQASSIALKNKSSDGGRYVSVDQNC